MNCITHRGILLACALSSGAALAQTAGLHASSSPRHADFERMPERDLKEMYLRCSREATQRLLGFDEAALCSVGYEVLKRRSFGGDFDALLAWSRAQGDVTEPSGERRSNVPAADAGN